MGADVPAGGLEGVSSPTIFSKQGAANTGLGIGTVGIEAFGAEKLSAVAKLPINGEASHAVKGSTPQRLSISLNTEVWSKTVRFTCGVLAALRLKGETTTVGTR